MITIRIAGTDATLSVLQNLAPSMQRQTIFGLSQQTYDDAQAGAGRHNKTGALFQSLYNRATPNGRAVGHDPQRAPHAVFVNLGTKPHDIRPKTKKVLRWSSGGKFIFAGFVKHPGYIGDPYLYQAADDAVRRMSAIVDDAFRRSTT